jgi:putative ABC transport system permease protein
MFDHQMKQVFRRMMRAPMFTAITLATLAIGIGANTAIFSVIEGVLLKALPFPHPEELVGVWHTAKGLNIDELNAAPALYFIYREEGRSFQEIGMWRGSSANVTGLAEPEHVDTIEVTDGTLPALGVSPVLGRWFSKYDDSAKSPKTVMLTYGYWQSRFGGDRSVLGRRILVDGEAREVIGVMPQSFRFLDQKPALITPLQFDRAAVVLGNFSFQALARLKPGVSLKQANADVARMIPLSIHKFPPPPGFNLKMFEDARIGPNVRPLKQDLVGDIGKVLWVLMGTISMVLLIACANVANLLLVRAEGRQQELAIRAALGAGWSRLARELLVESVTLGLLGGALGLALAYAALRVLVALAPANLPRLDEISIDPLVLWFTLAISLVSGMLFGLIPVLKYGRAQLGTGLRAGGRSLSQSRERHRARSALVIVQVALALVLLITSALMIRTFQALKHVAPGFTQPEQVETLRVGIPDIEVPEPDRVARMQQEMLDKIKTIPGVQSAALLSTIPMDSQGWTDPIYAEDRVYAEGKIPPLRRFKFISPALFQTMGIPLIAGRDLEWTDAYEKRTVAIVSENVARELWGSPAAALGKRIRESQKGPWREIVGVVGDVHDDGLNKKAATVIYWPLLMKDFEGNRIQVERYQAFIIRSARAGSDGFLKDIQKSVWSVDANLPIAEVRTLQEIYRKSLARTSFTLVMLVIAGSMALLLGIVGIYGVISYSVSQRTREIGIRMALGAQRQELTQMFVRHGLVLAAIGTASGLAAAAVLTRLMSSLLFEVQTVDPVSYGAVAAGLVGAAVLASYVPARRASTVDPVEALRAE